MIEKFISDNSKRANWIALLMIFIITFIALIFRRPDAFLNPQLWAEDGSVFLQQFEDNGIRSIIMPYAGYLHTIPRIVFYLFGALPVDLRYLPFCCNLSAFLLVVFVAYNLWQSAELLNVRHRLLYSIIFLFLPIGAEMFVNITNIIWFIAVYLVNFIFIGYKRGNIYLNTFIVILFGLSGPFSLLLSPVVLLILLIERKDLAKQKLIPFFAIMLCGAIQFIFIKQNGSVARGGAGEAEPFHLAKLIVNNVSDTLLLNSNILPEMSHLKQTAFCLIVFAIFLYLLINSYIKLDQSRKYVLIIAPILFLASFIFAFWPHEAQVTAFVCPRYYFVPYTCLAWIFIIHYDKKIDAKYIILMVVFFLIHSKRERSELPDKHWKEEIDQYQHGQRTDIDINPEGWKVTMPVRK